MPSSSSRRRLNGKAPSSRARIQTLETARALVYDNRPVIRAGGDGIEHSRRRISMNRYGALSAALALALSAGCTARVSVAGPPPPRVDVVVETPPHEVVVI